MTTEREAQVLRSLRKQGYAVTIFDPEELNGADPRKVEEQLGEAGYDIIQNAPKSENFEEKVEEVADKMMQTMDLASLLDYAKSSLIAEMVDVPGLYEEYLKKVGIPEADPDTAELAERQVKEGDCLTTEQYLKELREARARNLSMTTEQYLKKIENEDDKDQ